MCIENLLKRLGIHAAALELSSTVQAFINYLQANQPRSVMIMNLFSNLHFPPSALSAGALVSSRISLMSLISLSKAFLLGWSSSRRILTSCKCLKTSFPNCLCLRTCLYLGSYQSKIALQNGIHDLVLTHGPEKCYLVRPMECNVSERSWSFIELLFTTKWFSPVLCL